MKMTIGVLSDTHLRGKASPLAEIMDGFLPDVDVIFHVGDFVSPDVVTFLRQRRFHGVYGNMDPPEVRDMLPRKKIVTLGEIRIGLIHGWGAAEGLEERIWSEFKDTDVIVYGHSHQPANHLREGVLLFNPGTATGFSHTGFHSLGVLTIQDGVRGEIITIGKVQGLSRL